LPHLFAGSSYRIFLKHLLLICLACLGSFAAAAQRCALSLAGHVEDTDSKEKLAAATVFLKEANWQIITDANGDFVFAGLCEGNYTVVVSHVDCQSVERMVLLRKNQHLDIYLPHLTNVLKDVTVESVIGVPNTGFKKNLEGRRLEETKGLALAEALGKINGVVLLQTGNNVSKPIIHGLHSNRILTASNGATNMRLKLTLILQTGSR
jgi:iron complex outermembrane recepter protein